MQYLKVDKMKFLQYTGYNLSFDKYKNVRLDVVDNTNYDDLDVVKYMLSVNNTNDVNLMENTCIYGNLHIVEYLIKQNIPITINSVKNAIKNKHISIVKHIIPIFNKKIPIEYIEDSAEDREIFIYLIENAQYDSDLMVKLCKINDKCGHIGWPPYGILHGCIKNMIREQKKIYPDLSAEDLEYAINHAMDQM